MPIGDANPFSTIDEALWTALQDTVSTQGSNLDAWRKEQSSSGTRRGTDFTEGEVPPVTEWKVTDFPGLAVNTGGLSEGGEPSVNSTLLYEYPIEVIGAVRGTRDHVADLKACKAFAYRTLQLLILKAATCFDITGTTAENVQFTGVEFVELVDARDAGGVFAFFIGLTMDVRVSIT